jgi:hypothetical protein
VAVASDPLPERERVVRRANDLAASPPPWLAVERRAHVEAIDEGSVTLSGGRTVEAAVILGFTGHRPELAHLGELAVRISPVSEGAAGLHAALACVTDCLSVPRLAARDLDSGEPGFALIGSRSYGRMSSFLLQDGVRQLETLLDAMLAGAAR